MTVANSLCRAVEGVFSSQHMSVFSRPAGNDCNDPEDNDGDKGISYLGVGGQGQSAPLSASIVPERETMTSPGCSSDSRGTELDMPSSCEATRSSFRVGPAEAGWWMESTQAPITSIAATTSPLHPNCYGQETGCDAGSDMGMVNGGESVGSSPDGSVAQVSSETVFMSPDSDEETREVIEDSSIAAADWLDFARAMLDTSTLPD